MFFICLAAQNSKRYNFSLESRDVVMQIPALIYYVCRDAEMLGGRAQAKQDRSRCQKVRVGV
jgi:hypothetical protein